MPTIYESDRRRPFGRHPAYETSRERQARRLPTWRETAAAIAREDALRAKVAAARVLEARA